MARGARVPSALLWLARVLRRTRRRRAAELLPTLPMRVGPLRTQPAARLAVLSRSVAAKPDEPDDFALLDAWCDGDGAAGQQLFKRHFAAVYRFFCNKLGQDVDDLVQDTFVALTKAREKFRGDSAFRTFLFGIAYNQLLKARERAAKGRSLEAFESARAVAIDSSPSRVAARQQEQELLLRGLRRLPLDQQVVLELFYWEGCTSAQIAEIVGIPHGTVRSRLRLGRDALEALLPTLEADPKLVQSTLVGLQTWLDEMRNQVAPPEK